MSGKHNCAFVYDCTVMIAGTDTFMDMLHQSRISGWYESMMAAVGPSSRIAD